MCNPIVLCKFNMKSFLENKTLLHYYIKIIFFRESLGSDMNIKQFEEVEMKDHL